MLKQLKPAVVDPRSLIRFYCSCIRSVLGYACQAFHTSLPQCLSDDIGHIQKRALRDGLCCVRDGLCCVRTCSQT